MSSTDRRTDRRTRWIQYTPPPTSLGGGIKILSLFLLKSILVNTDFQTWFLIGWQHSHQPIRTHIRKSLLTNRAFYLEILPELACMSNYIPSSLVSDYLEQRPMEVIIMVACCQSIASLGTNVYEIYIKNTVIFIAEIAKITETCPIILMKFPSLSALEVVILTPSDAVSDENFIKRTFSFQLHWPFCWGLNQLIGAILQSSISAQHSLNQFWLAIN